MKILTNVACRPVGANRAGIGERAAITTYRFGSACASKVSALTRRLRDVKDEQEGQGTTEYAILVGVLVVIAIVAIVAFRGRIQELWNSIAGSINGL